MTRLLRTLRFFLQHSSWRPAPVWETADALALQAFLTSPAGTKLLAILHSEIAAANERAAMKALPFDCGWACGYRGLFAWFQSLAAPAPAATDDDGLSELEQLIP